MTPDSLASRTAAAQSSGGSETALQVRDVGHLTTPGERDPPALPVQATAEVVRAWFDTVADALIPAHDGTLNTARAAGRAYGLKAKATNTRKAYRAGVRDWCAFSARHGLPCLPARSEDVVAFLADARGRGLSISTVQLRCAAIRYLHYVAGCAVPTAEAHVTETIAGMRRDAADAGETPVKKLAATADILREIVARIPEDIRGLRDRALLTVGFAGALRRSELAAIRVEHIESRERGLRITLPRSKGERGGRAVFVVLPYGQTDLCPVRAIRRWQAAANIAEGPLFRRIWTSPTGDAAGPLPSPAIGAEPIDSGTVARILKRRAKDAGYDAAMIAGHSLKRGAMTTGMDRGVHPTKLKRLGRHKSYAVLDAYLEMGDPFEGHPLTGVL